MPELAEVELARRQWEPAHGRTVLHVETHPKTGIFRSCPAQQLEALRGLTMLSSRAHGKRLLFTFASEKKTARLHLELHLGMSGRLALSAPDHQTAKHDHLILRLSDLSLIFNDYRTFGKVLLHHATDPWSHLPPQPHEPTFTKKHLTELLVRFPNRPLKALLLDQAAFPGVGNWMADEICWRLGLHPATPSQEVDASRLWKESRFVCQGALKHVADANSKALASSAERGFAPGNYVALVPPKNWLFQHRWKKGGHCPRCGSELSRSTVATRTSAWCPICQKIQ